MKVLVSRPIVPGGVGTSEARVGEMALPDPTNPRMYKGIETGKHTTALLVVEKSDEKVKKSIVNFLEKHKDDETPYMRAGKAELDVAAAAQQILDELAKKLEDFEVDMKVYVSHNHRLFELNRPEPIDMTKRNFNDQAKWEAQAKKLGLEIYTSAEFGRKPNKTVIFAARKPGSKNIKYGEFKLGATEIGGVLYNDPLAFRRDHNNK